MCHLESLVDGPAPSLSECSIWQKAKTVFSDVAEFWLLLGGGDEQPFLLMTQSETLSFAHIYRYAPASGPTSLRRGSYKENFVAYSVVSKKSGTSYYLHTREVTLRGGRQQRIYYFAKAAGEGAVDDLPEGYVVSENPRTGLPLLKKG